MSETSRVQEKGIQKQHTNYYINEENFIHFMELYKIVENNFNEVDKAFIQPKNDIQTNQLTMQQYFT
jgi:archaellum component FlaC